MKFFQITAPNTSSGHDLGKVTCRFIRVRFHSDSDNTPFAFELNFFVRGRAISFQTKSVTQSNRPLNPQKLLLSKWTAVNPQEKEKHFLVTKVIDPEQPKHLIELVVMEALLTKRSFTMRWEDLTDPTKWMQGWI